MQVKALREELKTAAQERVHALEALSAEKAAARNNFDPALAAIMALLERKYEAVSQARRHIRIKALLEVWLFVHVPVTFALIAALVAHVISVFMYW